MTQGNARKMRDFSAKEGVYTGGALRFICKHSDFRLHKELRVRSVRESDGVVTWTQGNFVQGTSSESRPLLVVLGGIRLEVKTTLVKNQHGLLVKCEISGVVPSDIYKEFSVKPVTESTPKQKKRR